MSILTPRVHIGGQSSKYKIVNKGSSVPPWYPNYEKSNWWSGGDTYTGYYYSVHGNQLFIQYGKNAEGWAGTRFFEQSYEIKNEKVDEFNNVEADIIYTFSNFETFRTDFFASGVPVKFEMKLGDQLIATYTGETGSRATMKPKSPVTVHVKLAPQQKTSSTTLRQDTTYTTGIFPNASMYVGFDFFNPLPATYVAGETFRKSWISNNKNGYNKVYKNNSWSTGYVENNVTQNQANKGHTRVYKNNTFRQAKRY